MKAHEISTQERNFDRTGIDSNGKYHSLAKHRIKIPGTSERVDYVRVKPVSGDESYFYHSKKNKNQIVLHYTIGYLKGDIATLTTHDYHVSVPFVIGRNGTIYNLFYSGYWAYHLGPGALGGNATCSKSSIGVELSNIGPLKKHGGRLSTTYADTDTYCSTSATSLYHRESYRRFEYYATFTEAQYRSLIKLLRYLTARYNIRRKFLSIAHRFQTHRRVVGFNGIVSHVNYRRIGKEDIGPAFEWDRVEQGILA
jgi:N-acetyl-anhydromuramyl-L-alanine amidase AmpD